MKFGFEMSHMHIMVLALGNVDYYKDSYDVLIAYFKKYNLTYSFITSVDCNHKNAHPSWLKLLCHKICPGHDFILNWDLDLLPIKTACDISDYLDYSKLNMAVDSSLLAGHGGFTPNFKYNGGLIGMPSSLYSWAESVYDKHAPGTMPSYEQYYLNDEIVHNNIDVNVLWPKFNTLYPNGNNIVGHQLWNASDFRHYTFGCSTNLRPSKIREHKNEFFRI